MTNVETSKVASTLTSMLSAAAAIGILSQLYAYIAARGFFLAYGVNPAELEITPLNALLHLTTSTIYISLGLTLILGLFSLLSSVVSIFIHIKGGAGLTTLVQFLRGVWTITYPIKTITYLIKLYFLMAVVTQLIIAGSFIHIQSAKAGFAIKRGEESSLSAISKFLTHDLHPRRVLLEWRNDDDIPRLLKSSDLNLFRAQLLGRSGDRYVFYLEHERLLLRIEGTAVNILAPA